MRGEEGTGGGGAEREGGGGGGGESVWSPRARAAAGCTKVERVALILSLPLFLRWGRGSADEQQRGDAAEQVSDGRSRRTLTGSELLSPRVRLQVAALPVHSSQQSWKTPPTFQEDEFYKTLLFLSGCKQKVDLFFFNQCL